MGFGQGREKARKLKSEVRAATFMSFGAFGGVLWWGVGVLEESETEIFSLYKQLRWYFGESGGLDDF